MPRREGMRPDFASILPGAVSGSRPLPRPLAARQGEIPADRPAPPVVSSPPMLAPGPTIAARSTRRPALEMPTLFVTQIRVDTGR
jgi:hypothetical protein